MATPSEQIERKVQQLDNDVQAIYQMISFIQATQGRHTNRFDELNTRLDGFNARLGSVETSLGSVETRLDTVEIRLGRLETKTDGIDVKLDEVLRRLEP